MIEHRATVEWTRPAEAPFVDNRYPRVHTWSFDGGAVVRASPSPHVVRIPLSDPAAVDPEEALVAAAASCHMLWFLSLAAKRGFVVDSYRDEAVGELGRDERGRMALTRITLRPEIRFTSHPQPTANDLDGLHHAAHDSCYIANSLRTPVVIEPR